MANGTDGAASLGDKVGEARAALMETRDLVSIVVDEIETWITSFVEMLPNLIVASLVVLLAAIMAVKKAFDEAGIEIPFPIRTLDLGAEASELLRGAASAQRSPGGDDGGSEADA